MDFGLEQAHFTMHKLVCVVSQCKLMSSWGLKKPRLPPFSGPLGSGKLLLIFTARCVFFSEEQGGGKSHGLHVRIQPSHFRQSVAGVGWQCSSRIRD